MRRTELVATLRAAGCVYAEDEAALLSEAATDAGALDALVARRVAGEPLEYVLGWAEFAGLRLSVADGVFVPRRRTTVLLDLAVRATSDLPAPRLLELCCGVAPVASAFAARAGVASVVAADLDPAAVVVARANLEPRGGVVFAGDLFAALPAGSGPFDVVVANAPYVPTGEIVNMPGEARDHEHLMALDGGADGLALHRRIAVEAAPWLAAGGVLLVETSGRQARADAALFAAAGWAVEIVVDDEYDGTAVLARAGSPFAAAP